jgi:hypothetical protein
MHVAPACNDGLGGRSGSTTAAAATITSLGCHVTACSVAPPPLRDILVRRSDRRSCDATSWESELPRTFESRSRQSPATLPVTVLEPDLGPFREECIDDNDGHWIICYN